MLKKITCQEADVLMQDSQVLIVDVRDQESYNEGHIPNAIHMTSSLLQEMTLQMDKKQPVLVYCYHGISSQSVAQCLIEQGFVAIYSLTGGFEAWQMHHSASDASK